MWRPADAARLALEIVMRDDDKRFDRPVKLMIGGPGKVRIVTSTRETAECLMQRWPAKGGGKHLQARLACLAVLEGAKPASLACKALEAAAEEVGILVP